MGFLAGSASFVRFAVQGELPGDFWEFVAERVRAFSFRDIDDSFEERSVGWVSVHDMFDSEFAYASYAAGDAVVLALRIDERKVPAAVLKKLCLKEEQRLKRERQVPRLSRAHRQEIKENVRLALLKQAVPTPAVYDLVWDLASATVLFFSTNKKAIEVVEQYFKETFGLTLVQQVPYLVAERLLDDPEARQRLAAAGPEVLV